MAPLAYTPRRDSTHRAAPLGTRATFYAARRDSNLRGCRLTVGLRTPRRTGDAIAPVLAAQYAKLVDAGWSVSEADVQRDVRLLFGGAFEAFLAK